MYSAPDEKTIKGKKITAPPAQAVTKIDLVDAMQYVPQFGGDEEAAAKEAAYNQLWYDVARDFKILTGEKQHDLILWEAHIAFTRGLRPDDPMSNHQRAIEEFEKRSDELHLREAEIVGSLPATSASEQVAPTIEET